MNAILATTPFTTFIPEEWTIDQSQKTKWEELLAKNNLTQETIDAILSARQVATIHFGTVFPSERPLPEITKPSGQPTLLWTDDQVEIYAPPSPRVRHHLWVALKRPIDKFSEVTADETVALRSNINKICSVLRSHFQMPAIIAQWNEAQPGQLANRFTMEVIPPRLDSREVLNNLDKTECNYHVLFKNQYPTTLSGPTKEEQARDIVFWQNALRQEAPPFSRQLESDPAPDWTQVQTQKRQGFTKLLDNLEQLARAEGIEIDRKKPPADPTDIPLIYEKQGCRLCLPSVIDSQLIFEAPLVRVLCTYKPSSPGAQFLIVPKRHVSSSDLLRKDEWVEIHKLAQCLTEILEKKTNRTDIKMYMQDGPAVGQTEPHSQMQLMLTPPAMRYALIGMNYDWETPLTKEQMQPMINEFRQQLEKTFR